MSVAISRTNLFRDWLKPRWHMEMADVLRRRPTARQQLLVRSGSKGVEQARAFGLADFDIRHLQQTADVYRLIRLVCL